jgi:hypothetical protein
LSIIDGKSPRGTVAILDCCRRTAEDHPRAVFGVKKELHGCSAPAASAETLTLYACARGAHAYSGGRNGAFTSVLLQHMGTPGQTVAQLARLVRKDVIRVTKGKQCPELCDATTEDICLVPAEPDPAGEPEPEPHTLSQTEPDSDAAPAREPKTRLSCYWINTRALRKQKERGCRTNEQLATSVLAEDLLNDGVRLIEEQQWERAADMFSQVLRLAPDYTNAEEWLETATLRRSV